MDATPADLARAVVLEGLKADVQLFVALQYLDLIDGRGLQQLFAADLAPEPATVDVPVSLPTAELSQRPGSVLLQEVTLQRLRAHDPYPVLRERKGGHLSRERTLFAQWMEKTIPWSPEVFGWTADDPRCEAFYGR